MITGAAEPELLRAERHAALREAFMHLPPGSRQLIALLVQDPPVPYAEISARLGIPVGSIGPSRSRCLEKLRRYPAIAALINAEARNAGVDTRYPADGAELTVRSSLRMQAAPHASSHRNATDQRTGLDATRICVIS